MIDLPYSLVVEATEDPTFFGFFSAELEGFSGTGQSIEDCLDRARDGMREHVELLRESSLPAPPRVLRPGHHHPQPIPADRSLTGPPGHQVW